MATAAGYFEQRTGSPVSLGMVVLAHVVVLGALVLIKGPEIIGPDRPLVVRTIEIPPEPPSVPPEHDEAARQDPVTTYRSPEQEFDPPDEGPVTTSGEATTTGDPGPIGTGVVRDPPADPPLPVRRDAAYDQRYADALQPPYPPSEERAQRIGRVRLRVTIGPNGRVTRVTRLDATSDAFWRATERQALSRWRFRPATVDGRPVESSMVFTVTFRIADV